MFKSFKLWLESKKEVKKVLLDRLGLEDPTVKIRQIDIKKLKSVLQSINLEEDKLNSIMAWLKKSPDARLIELINQLGDIDIENEEDEEDLAGQQASLPQGQPMLPSGSLNQTANSNMIQ